MRIFYIYIKYMSQGKKIYGFLFIAIITLINYLSCSSHSTSTDKLPYVAPSQRFCSLPVIPILIAAFIIFLFY
jgi:hypothetical protein